MLNKRSGFTLIELVLVIALIGIISTVSYSIFFTGQKSFELGIGKGIGQEDNRIFREYIVKELRYTSYLSNNKPDSEIYHSLSIVSDTNGYRLEKKKYEENKVLNTEDFAIKFNSLTISSLENTIKVEFVPLHGEKNYDYSIALENNFIENNINLNETNKTIYYTYPEDLQVATDMPNEEPDEDIEDDNQDKPLEGGSEDKIEFWDSSKKYRVGDKVNYNDKIYESLKKIMVMNLQSKVTGKN